MSGYLICGLLARADSPPQLTSLYSMQTSLDILRKYRPDYTPRTGFAWPVMMPEETSKKRRVDEAVTPAGSQPVQSSEPQPQAGSTQTTLDKEKAAVAASASNKQQNMSLLLNAMRTTAAHSHKTFALQMEQSAAEQTVATDEPMSASSSLPSALPTSVGTPQASISTAAPAEIPVVRAPQGAGKKKKKRELSPS